MFFKALFIYSAKCLSLTASSYLCPSSSLNRRTVMGKRSEVVKWNYDFSATLCRKKNKKTEEIQKPPSLHLIIHLFIIKEQYHVGLRIRYIQGFHGNWNKFNK